MRTDGCVALTATWYGPAAHEDTAAVMNHVHQKLIGELNAAQAAHADLKKGAPPRWLQAF